MEKKIRLNPDRIVSWTVYIILFITIITVFIALFGKRTSAEAPIGSFESTEFNDNWVLTENGESKTISLPYEIHSTDVKELTISNTLPSDLHGGMSLMTRANMSDIYIYIDGVLRGSYATENFDRMSYYISTAYNVVELTKEDAGKKISITFHPKASVRLGEVYISNGNNGWFRVIRSKLMTIAIAFVVLILGILLAVISKVMQRISKDAGKGFYLGLFMIDISIWVFSESHLQQLIFARPSMTQYFSYLSLELLGPLACLFFDTVQNRQHHRSYFIIEVISTLQIIANVILHFTGIAQFYQTLRFSHVWIILGIITAMVNIIRDIRTGSIRQYIVTAIGIVVLLSTGVVEFIFFYAVRYYSIGFVASFGLIFLAAATIIQTLLDQMRSAREREEQQTQMIVNTVESIAMAIDAKDAYTGGHSERVSQYATILAGKMAGEYGFSENDIQRIRYIGLMHDIGKIGVADSVLNKPGRLNDTEFGLMKKSRYSRLLGYLLFF